MLTTPFDPITNNYQPIRLTHRGYDVFYPWDYCLLTELMRTVVDLILVDIKHVGTVKSFSFLSQSSVLLRMHNQPCDRELRSDYIMDFLVIARNPAFATNESRDAPSTIVWLDAAAGEWMRKYAPINYEKAFQEIVALMYPEGIGKQVDLGSEELGLLDNLLRKYIRELHGPTRLRTRTSISGDAG